MVVKNYFVPEKLKKEFRKLYGKILENIDKSRLKGKKIISVGDFTTYRLLLNGIEPYMAIVDGKVERIEIPKEMRKVLNEYGKRVYVVKNPPSHITQDLYEEIRRGLKRNGSKIVVDGEEDLAVLPLILEVDIGTLILYGYPKKGMIMLKVNERIKEHAKELLNRLEVIC